MFCIPIVGPSLIDVQSQIERAMDQGDLLEFRVDLFDKEVLPHLNELREQVKLPVIFKGGGRLCNPDYYDSEREGDIVSHHNFKETPDLDALLASMPDAPLRKIVTFAKTTNDALRMILFTRRHKNVLGMCLGEKGLVTRIVGRPWRYAALSEHERSVPGQPTLKELKNYGPGNHLYGLIGGTVHQSPSHLTHNRALRRLGIDASYVKMAVAPDELEEFLNLAKEVGFKGLSVTIPHKEAIIPLLDHVESRSGSVNTLTLEKGDWVGFDTDGPGALAVLPDLMRHVVILGAGGAARSLAYHLREIGVEVTVLNRSLNRPLAMGTLDQLDQLEYDGLINTTPHPNPVVLKKPSWVMDINHHASGLVDQARLKGWQAIEGRQMFFEQAARQFQRWFNLPSHQALSALMDELATAASPAL